MSPKSLDERSSVTNVTSDTNTDDDDEGGISDRSIVNAPAIDAIPISPSIFSDTSSSCSLDGLILKISPVKMIIITVIIVIIVIRMTIMMHDDSDNDDDYDYLAHVLLPLLMNLISFSG